MIGSRGWGRPGWALVAAAGAMLLSGCGQRSGSPSAPAAAPAAAAPGRERFLAGLVSMLSELDRYDEQRAAEQSFERLVQWSHAAGATGGGQPAVASLPAALRTASEPIVTRDTFDALADVTAIRDRVWLAAVAQTARAGVEDDLQAAGNLFRWTVRSLAPVSDPPMVPTEATPGSRWFLPGEILLSGRASAAQRAWIFVELLRQEGIDGVMLAISGPDGFPRPWVPAALIGGEAYLFESGYGMPIPGPGGTGVATLRQAAADPAILAALSLPDRPYPVQAADLAGVVPLVVADPWTLAPRMARLDADLRQRHGIAVAVDPQAVASRAAAALPEPVVEATSAADAGKVALWMFPFETLARRSLADAARERDLGPLASPLVESRPGGEQRMTRPLFAARVREFRGEYAGPLGAKAAYLEARPSRAVIARTVAGLPEPAAAEASRRLGLMKEDATYWLGVLLLAEGEPEAAADYLRRMTLEASPDSRWADAARINLAAAEVALGRPAVAAELLRQDASPQRFGSRLEATRLERGVASSPEASP